MLDCPLSRIFTYCLLPKLTRSNHFRVRSLTHRLDCLLALVLTPLYSPKVSLAAMCGLTTRVHPFYGAALSVETHTLKSFCFCPMLPGYFLQFCLFIIFLFFLSRHLPLYMVDPTVKCRTCFTTSVSLYPSSIPPPFS